MAIIKAKNPRNGELVEIPSYTYMSYDDTELRQRISSLEQTTGTIHQDLIDLLGE